MIIGCKHKIFMGGVKIDVKTSKKYKKRKTDWYEKLTRKAVCDTSVTGWKNKSLGIETLKGKHLCISWLAMRVGNPSWQPSLCISHLIFTFYRGLRWKNCLLIRGRKRRIFFFFLQIHSIAQVKFLPNTIRKKERKKERELWQQS